MILAKDKNENLLFYKVYSRGVLNTLSVNFELVCVFLLKQVTNSLVELIGLRKTSVTFAAQLVVLWFFLLDYNDFVFLLNWDISISLLNVWN